MKKKIKLLTKRQFLFLNWLYNRKIHNTCCDLANIKIECFNCLNNDKKCKEGVMPASYFYKKIQRQYFDCKRILDSLIDLHLIDVINLSGKDFHVFYKITNQGITFFEEFSQHDSIIAK